MVIQSIKKKHISNSIFFDIDENSKKNIDLPHMLVEIEDWNKIVSSMGINNKDEIIIYDNSDVLSACRCWYNFIYFGHDPKLVSVLNGGLRKWKQESKKISNEVVKFSKTNYIGRELISLVKDKYKIHLNISDNFYDHKNLSLNEYCKVFDGQFYLMYFKNENQNCNN